VAFGHFVKPSGVISIIPFTPTKISWVVRLSVLYGAMRFFSLLLVFLSTQALATLPVWREYWNCNEIAFRSSALESVLGAITERSFLSQPAATRGRELLIPEENLLSPEQSHARLNRRLSEIYFSFTTPVVGSEFPAPELLVHLAHHAPLGFERSPDIDRLKWDRHSDQFGPATQHLANWVIFSYFNSPEDRLEILNEMSKEPFMVNIQYAIRRAFSLDREYPWQALHSWSPFLTQGDRHLIWNTTIFWANRKNRFGEVSKMAAAVPLFLNDEIPLTTVPLLTPGRRKLTLSRTPTKPITDYLWTKAGPSPTLETLTLGDLTVLKELIGTANARWVSRLSPLIAASVAARQTRKTELLRQMLPPPQN
jgi:hypothetical protein